MYIESKDETMWSNVNAAAVVMKLYVLPAS